MCGTSSNVLGGAGQIGLAPPVHGQRSAPGVTGMTRTITARSVTACRTPSGTSMVQRDPGSDSNQIVMRSFGNIGWNTSRVADPQRTGRCACRSRGRSAARSHAWRRHNVRCAPPGEPSSDRFLRAPVQQTDIGAQEAVSEPRALARRSWVKGDDTPEMTCVCKRSNASRRGFP